MKIPFQEIPDLEVMNKYKNIIEGIDCKHEYIKNGPITQTTRLLNHFHKRSSS